MKQTKRDASKRKNKPVYMCDFETTSTENYAVEARVRVWAFCCLDIKTLGVVSRGTDIQDFIDFISGNGSAEYFFHNLKFDGSFIVSYLLENGYKYVESKKNIQPREFTTCINDLGAWYNITICFDRVDNKPVTASINDSLKLLPFSAAKIAKDFELPTSKGEIDYTKFRPLGYEPMPDEWDYIQNDCVIIASALRFFVDKGLNKLTIGSNALAFYKQLIGVKRYKYLFPILNNVIDTDIRQSYKGGFVYANPRYTNKELENVISYDVNSLYPSVMYFERLPYGQPVYFEGEPKPTPGYPLFILFFEAAFEIKADHIPTIQLKRNPRFCPTDYVKTSGGEILSMCMTSVDLKLFFEQYNVTDYKPIEGFYFRAAEGLFKEYIDTWYEIKQNATGAKRALAKLMLNNLYGKFATNPLKQSKMPVMNDDGVVKYVVCDPVECDPVYTVEGAFITAYARYKTISTAQRLYPYFCYADTDSVHLVGILPEDVEKLIDVDNARLGAWKFEGIAERAKFLRAKTYIKIKGSKQVVTCAGMPERVKQSLNYRDFKINAVFDGKLCAKIVRGGTLLCETTFKINC